MPKRVTISQGVTLAELARMIDYERLFPERLLGNSQKR